MLLPRRQLPLTCVCMQHASPSSITVSMLCIATTHEVVLLHAASHDNSASRDDLSAWHSPDLICSEGQGLTFLPAMMARTMGPAFGMANRYRSWAAECLVSRPTFRRRDSCNSTTFVFVFASLYRSNI